MMNSKYFATLAAKVVRGKRVFIASGAVVFGDVALGDEASVWFNAVVRGDEAPIRIGARTNVQDGSVLHADPGDPCILGAGVVIGHNAIVHGAEVMDNSLIGMGATVLNRAVIGKNCIVGANALVTAGTEIPEGSLVLGSPAKVVKTLAEKQIEDIRKNAQGYVQKAARYLDLD